MLRLVTHSVLWIAFGVGVWQSAGSSAPCGFAAAGLIVNEVEGSENGVTSWHDDMHMV